VERKKNFNIVRPKPQESFTKFSMRCPVHTKARCGRAFCSHPLINSKNNRCSKYNCPFYKESEELMSRNSKHEYRIHKRFRSVLK